MMRRPQTMIANFFVYGTLKRGECRESMWPRRPLEIRPAYVRAHLFDLGDYPAIRVDSILNADCVEHASQTLDDGLDWVRGEVWTFDRNDVLATLLTLDEIEVTNQVGHANLYDQILVRAYSEVLSEPQPVDTSVLALAYQYSRPLSTYHSRRLRPALGSSFVLWTAGSSRE
jgi:gamma-glutamylcyclotransferase (GGCT)/AIG2-like uncharacterized protein YtfP